MRLHSLTLEAFGPFVAAQRVDFDDLCQAGVFLVHGPTGAGKTSVLDAVCYALFANVPGARQARGLRSDHAPAEVRARVVLDLTAGGRRLRIGRQPEFVRAKQRGTGLTKDPPTVLIEERIGGDWRPLTTRIDEAAELIDHVVGMGLEQFGRVALLPQGDFAAFLRSSAEDRRALLERLFDVSVFTGVESWLVEERRRLVRSVEQDGRTLDIHVRHLTDLVAGLPETVLAPSLEEGIAGTPLRQWSTLLGELRSRLAAHALEALTRHEQCVLAERAAADRHREAERSAGLAMRGRLASTALAALTERDGDMTKAAARLDRATRASALRGELADVLRAEEQLAAADAAHTSSGADLAAAGLHDDGTALPSARLIALSSALAAMSPVLHEAWRQSREVGELVGAVEAAAAAHRAADERSAVATGAIAEVRAAVDEATARVSSLIQAAGMLDAAKRRREESTRLVRLREEADAAAVRGVELAAGIAAARTAELDAREALLALRQVRLEDLAGELASTLADGHPCPVCGSPDHPHVATRRSAWSPDLIDAAELAADAAVAVTSALVAEEAAVAARHRARLEDLGDRDSPVAVLRVALSEATAAVARAASSARSLPDARARLVSAEERARALDEDRARCAQQLAVAEAARRDVTDRALDARQRVTRSLAVHDADCPCVRAGAGTVPRTMGESDVGDPGSDLAATAARHEHLTALVDTHQRAAAAVALARRDHAGAASALDEALASAGFGGRPELESALLTFPDMEALTTSLREHAELRAAHEATLADTDVIAALAEAIDPTQTADRHAAARGALLESQAHSTVASRVVGQVETQVEAILDVVARLAPTADRLDAVTDLADLVTGTSASNTYRMKLSSFVLAARLERVVELANERLHVMGEGRYQLCHDDAPTRGGGRSGLGLLVLDQWTGASRHPASLSGGESFMTSLALALALADAVRESVGGFELQTLFVDEGFGSLDEESLEEVMSVLDGLRDGGRSVGVVSHVADLRARITERLEVVKTPQGSRLVTRSGCAAAS